LCDDTLSCQSCLKKPFHSFDGKTPNGNKVLDCWNKENHKKSHEEFLCSGRKYKFNCDSCPHTFDSSLCDIVSKGNWCPICKNKTEKVVLEFLQNQFSKKDVKHQFKHEKVKNIRELPFDICILPHKIIIEVDGEQHFFDVSHFKSHAVEQCERDCNKMKIIFEEGYCVIRIVQADIWLQKTRDEMLSKLEKAIQECIHNELPKIHYISVNDSMYDNHKRIISESYSSSSTSSSPLHYRLLRVS
jgi:very-short-patch-repair endonuclease